MVKKLFIIFYIFIGTYALFQASKLVSTIVEKRILEYTVDTKVKKGQETGLTFTDTLHYDASISLFPLFSQTEIEQEEVTETPIVDSPMLRKYELNGVIVLPGDRSIALIRKSGEKESQIYRIGDSIGNAEIVKIERHRIHLTEGGKTVILPMYYKYIAKSIKSRAEPSSRDSSLEKYTGSKQIKKVLSRSDVENKVFKRVNEILTQIAISPYMIDGKMEGLRLVRVPKANIIYEMGGRSGDLVRRVNGHELNQIDQMYKLWENVRDDSHISVDIERNKQIYTYDFDIRE